MDLISLVIINYNNKSYLKRCLTSIENQTYKNLEIIFIDNESKDGSFEFMKEEYSEKNILLIRNEVNNGYSGAANQGIKLSKGKYVMILNPDIIMEKDFIENMYGFIDKDERIGALSGKLLKYDFENDKKLNYIDSAGIDMYKNRKFKDRGQNELDIGQYEKTEVVFGVCGAAPLYRKSILDKISINGEYFDEDFFAYKEDIDVSWRINLLGYKNIYYPNAVAYHGRGLGSSSGGILKFINNRKSQSEFLRGISLRNQILLLKKNETEESVLGDKLKINIRKILLMGYFIMFERFSFKYIKEANILEDKILEKRKIFFEKNNKLNYDFLRLMK